MKFEELPGTKKGYIGEGEVDKYLTCLGIVPYSPIIGKSHPFDRLCASSDKKKIFVAECKTKASRTYYPDTGMNESNYQDYRNILDNYRIDIWLFFVDENTKTIYGNLLSELDKPIAIVHNGKRIEYPLVQKDTYGHSIRYFPLVSMKEVCKISDAIAKDLKNLSRRNYEYSATASLFADTDQGGRR